MSTAQVIQMLVSIVPTIVVGVIAYNFFKKFVENEDEKRRYEMRKVSHKDLIPNRIQALERMTLFLERINPGSLLLRIQPNSDDKKAYGDQLIHSIDQEFQHNLTQQIYISDACWNAIKSTKNATIGIIRKSIANDQVNSAQELRETIMSQIVEHEAPSETGLAYIRKEARDLF